jgi:hypothetical protein
LPSRYASIPSISPAATFADITSRLTPGAAHAASHPSNPPAPNTKQRQ